MLATASILSLVSGSALPIESELVARKALGGPAIANIAVYPSYKCTGPSTAPPYDATIKSISVTEEICQVLSVPLGSAVSANLTQTPKTGVAGCYINFYKTGSCAVSFDNYYVGYAFQGTTVGSKLPCVNPMGGAKGAIEITCF
ncbi:hypothetical protein BP5796_06074 [Coleophoma crateriformis]|uniref:Uncharacterized protein n=1 Tax=Coleophoma crateriformis TaxID=565419 RepID=A0A3D8RVX9_9HELO|nr:hypothetical protein BP5796_06074 [Coleophoma crateriformis]